MPSSAKTLSVPSEPPIAWPPSTPIIDATLPSAAIRSTSSAERASSSRSGLRRTRSRRESICSNVMVTARSTGRSEGTYTDQNWPPTPPAAMRGRSVIRVGSAGSRPCRSSHSRSLWPSMSGAARRRSSKAGRMLPGRARREASRQFREGEREQLLDLLPGEPGLDAEGLPAVIDHAELEQPERAEQIESLEPLSGGSLVQLDEQVLPHGPEGHH